MSTLINTILPSDVIVSKLGKIILTKTFGMVSTLLHLKIHEEPLHVVLNKINNGLPVLCDDQSTLDSPVMKKIYTPLDKIT